MSRRTLVFPAGAWLRLVDRYAIWIVLLALLAVAALLSDAFLRPSYLLNIVRQAAPVGIAAVGVTAVMIAGGVDLSVGAVISLTAVVGGAHGRRFRQHSLCGRRRCWWARRSGSPTVC